MEKVKYHLKCVALSFAILAFAIGVLFFIVGFIGFIVRTANGDVPNIFQKWMFWIGVLGCGSILLYCVEAK